MSIKRLSHSLIIILSMIGVSSCSNNTNNAPQKRTVIHQVKSDTKVEKLSKQKEYTSLLDQWKKEDLAPKRKAYVKPKVVSKAKKHIKPRVIQKRHVQKKKIKSNQYSNNKLKYRAPSFRAPINNIRYASLSGDYANNKNTHAFINKMVTKHGFDRGYLNYLLSSTKATAFLKKMAYRDAFGNRKSKGKTKRRSGRWNRYRDNFLTEKTINKGIQFWRNNRVALKRAEQKYGVPQEYILGIIGVETRYGGNVGKNRAIDALAAMGFNNPRRGKYFTSELEAYLLMTRKERLDPLKPMASYAGALGLSQFMPSNIKRYAVDHDRSGTVNLWTPHDAIGSVANYFKKHGWRTGGTVAVPA